MMVRKDIFLPSSLCLQSTPYCDNWQELKGIDTYTLDRAVRASGWNLLFVAGEMRTSVRGIGPASVRQGIERLTSRLNTTNLNCIQITTSEPKRFLGFSYLSFSAYGYHIQEGRSLPVTPAASAGLATSVLRSLW